MTQTGRIKLGTSALIGAVVLSVPAWAETRVAPDYFLDAVVATSTAQQLALSCPGVSIDPVAVQNASGDVLARLEDDGFDVGRDDLGMIDPSDALLSRQQAFMAKHDLADGAEQAAVCASARAEIAEGTQIGSYLIEVAE